MRVGLGRHRLHPVVCAEVPCWADDELAREVMDTLASYGSDWSDVVED